MMPGQVIKYTPGGGTQTGTYQSGLGSGAQGAGKGKKPPNPIPTVVGQTVIGKDESGSGIITNLAKNAQVTVWGWRECHDREGLGLIFRAAASRAFHLNYFFTPDDGVSKEIGVQVASTPGTHLDGGASSYTHIAALQMSVGYLFRVEIANPNNQDLAVGYEYRLYERV